MPTPFFRFTDREVTHAVTAIDFAGNSYRACSYLITHSNNSGVLVRRFAPDGTLTGEWDRPPISPRKINSFDMVIAGADLLFSVAYHDAVSTEGRESGAYPDALPGVVLAPYPHGLEPEGAPTDTRSFLGGDSEPVPSEPVDYARIERLIAAHVDGLAAQFGGSSIRDGIQQKVMDALVALLAAPDSDPRAKPWRDRFAQFSRDRTYEAGLEVLRHAPEESVLTQAARHILQPPG